MKGWGGERRARGGRDRGVGCFRLQGGYGAANVWGFMEADMAAESKTPDLDHIDVRYVAHLARLALTEEEAGLFQRQLDDVVGYVRTLQAVDVDGVEPTSHARPQENVFRADAPREGLDGAAVLANAPRADGGLFLVPKIVE